MIVFFLLHRYLRESLVPTLVSCLFFQISGD